MKSSNKKNVQLLVEQCVTHGLKHVVFSPGSRNAPLIIAMDEHPEINCYVVHDERSAAFFALGMAQQLGSPVGIVCTSGSAAANYFPAVSEAYYQCVPLVVITADRQQEWINQGDGQTIMQQGIFGNHVRYACQIGENVAAPVEKWAVERELAVAFSHATSDWKGPVHINISFGEPLYGTEEIEYGKGRTIEVLHGAFSLNGHTSRVIEKGLELPRKLVICGQHVPDKFLLEQLSLFAEDASVAVLVENTSNLVDMKFVHCIDRTLNAITEDELEKFSPDLLISIGGAVVSKKIKAYFRKFKPVQHWKVGFEFPYMDTYQALTHSFQADAGRFFAEINKLQYRRNLSNFGAKWKQKDFLVQDKLPEFYTQLPYSDLKVFETILDYVPDQSHLHMANSSVVRYCQLFNPVKAISYWSNRGTSGIDGSSSTAAGAAMIKKDMFHVLITGDVSFFYDSNAFWNQYLTPNLRVMLINNSGGGIFKIIPGPASTDQLEKYFEAKHAYSAEKIAEAFNLDYFCAHSIDEIESQMRDFYQYEEDGRPKIMEIFTPGDENHLRLEEFFNYAKLN